MAIGRLWAWLAVTAWLGALVPALGAEPARAATAAEMRRGAEIRQRIAALDREDASLRRIVARLEARSGSAASERVQASLQAERQAALARRTEIARDLEALGDELSGLPPAARTEPPPPAPGARTPLDPQGLTPLDVLGGVGQATERRAFNPGLAVIPDVAYFRDDRRGQSPAVVEQADGFHGVHADDDHAHGELAEGFNLRETELAFTASVDPYFDAVVLFALSEDGIEAEEIYAQTRGLPGGLQLRAGRFLSGVGYINRQHPHQWDFLDQNLAVGALLGPHGLAEKGVQVTWLPRLPLFLQIGGELFQGENEKFAHYIGPETFSGTTPSAPERVLSHQAGPRLFTGFVKVAPDLGYAHAVQVGGSFMASRKHQEIHDHDGGGSPEDVLDGTATLWGVDAVYRYDSPRPYGQGDLTLQAEYLHRLRTLDLVGTPLTVRLRNDGLYLQATYGIAPRWQAAARLSAAGLVNERVRGDAKVTWETSSVSSVALTFNPTEFSRLRAQYNRGRVWVDREAEAFHQMFVQLQISLGAHGAHPF